MTLLRRGIGALQFVDYYGNSLQILWKRALRDGGRPLHVVDRRSGIRCLCNVASYRMFGEVWHDRCYDVPKLPIREGDVVLDIGANRGFYSLYAAVRGARVFAFEPAPDAFADLVRNVKSNRCEDRVRAYPWALGAQNGTVELLCNDRLGGGMNTTNAVFSAHEALETHTRVAVPCRTLSDAMNELGVDRVRICKLDCEGAELEILKQLGPEELGRIDAFTLEYHIGAYRLEELVDLLMSWKTHQISFAEDTIYPRAIIRAVANHLLPDCLARQ